jgi:hypothetical protein
MFDMVVPSFWFLVWPEGVYGTAERTRRTRKITRRTAPCLMAVRPVGTKTCGGSAFAMR